MDQYCLESRCDGKHRRPYFSVGLPVLALFQFLFAQMYPSDIIHGLSNWKITLPVDPDGNDSSRKTDVDDRNRDAMEVKDENLIDYEYPPYFHARDGEVIFRAHCAGATTGGSKYPRSELRQRCNGGDNYWSMNDPQYLLAELRVTHVPAEKPEVCMVQIHGPEDEPLRVQYHADIGVYIRWNESNSTKDNPVAYAIGERLRAQVTVDNGDITCNIDNIDRNVNFKKTWASSDSRGYFKAGCYTQSSIFLSQFKSGMDDEPMDSYGEVVFSKISLTRETTGMREQAPRTVGPYGAPPGRQPDRRTAAYNLRGRCIPNVSTLRRWIVLITKHGSALKTSSMRTTPRETAIK